MKRIGLVLFLLAALSIPAEAAGRKSDTAVSCKAMERALELSTASQELDRPIPWTELLAMAAAYGEGDPSSVNVVHVYHAKAEGKTADEILNGNSASYAYWLDAYETVLGGIVGEYAEKTDGEWKEYYGIKAYFPIADGYRYTYDSGSGASECLLVSQQGTPVVAIESGTVETMGWDRHNGWQIGIRSADQKRRFRYSCLHGEMPFAQGIRKGDRVDAGQVIGFMGKSGIPAGKTEEHDEAGYLRLGMQLIGRGKRGVSGAEHWVDLPELLQLLESSKSTVIYDSTSGNWKPLHPRTERNGQVLG